MQNQTMFGGTDAMYLGGPPALRRQRAFVFPPRSIFEEIVCVEQHLAMARDIMGSTPIADPDKDGRYIEGLESALAALRVKAVEKSPPPTP